MAFLQIKSTNPKFSYLIRKNPESGMTARELRKGVLFGYFSDDNQIYNVYFRDAFNGISYTEYKDQEFEYVNATRYSSAQFVLNAISELFRDAFKKRDEELDPDDSYSTIITLNMVKLGNKRILNSFTSHFSSTCSIEAEEIAHKHYRIKITTMKSLFYILNLTNLFAVFNVLRNKTEYLPLDEGAVTKYFSALSVIDAPYFIRYHFKVNLLRGNRIFKQYKPMLEKSEHYPIEMQFGDAAHMRLDALGAEINFSHHLVDVGCGEGSYALAFNKRMLKGNKYFAIDTNEACRNTVHKKVRIKKLINVIVLDSIQSFLAVEHPLEEPRETPTKVDFILGEVIEHMSLEEATEMVTRCLAYPQCGSVLISTPNMDFNQFFFDDEKGLRHPDHKFEFTAAEFKAWVEKLPFSCVEFKDIGDKVNGIPMTLGVVLTPKIPLFNNQVYGVHPWAAVAAATDILAATARAAASPFTCIPPGELKKAAPKPSLFQRIIKKVKSIWS